MKQCAEESNLQTFDLFYEHIYDQFFLWFESMFLEVRGPLPKKIVFNYILCIFEHIYDQFYFMVW